ncbi:type I-C CRISPR-associated protein Cas5 [Sulfuriferula plumbiphila]|uniref:pre-crRNA processing endonuclease n=1 Tax=Sulfuriferula plumbiphila TaxID=171865 RepID=A0A512L754_9PROT|nr:type I-C CRISPR-associated protein Cas5c [Sulfuriferula plumbiphila]BBP05278.1 type I-C CRISPR-associated protein Cas5 [Sulfuriferula plumbiphila]GEP30316.1 type I-C CRISPR-associated protein Cas5 [Sulfuriferula plumbiphila]
MPKTLCLKVWGDFACFTRPEMKVERVSYDVITPSAARAVFEAILWKPEIRWTVTKIEVLKPIKWISVRRNEIGKVASADNGQGDRGLYIEEHRQQRAGLFLRDVAYRLHAQFEVVDGSKHVHHYPELRGRFPAEPEESQPEHPAKYLSMFQRRAKKGQCFWQPYLGCREFSAHFELVDDAAAASLAEPPISDSPSLGWMLHDIDFADAMRPGFFRAEMKSGIIDLEDVEVRR